MPWKDKMADLLRNSEILAATFPNRISDNNCTEGSPFARTRAPSKPLTSKSLTSSWSCLAMLRASTELVIPSSARSALAYAGPLSTFVIFALQPLDLFLQLFLYGIKDFRSVSVRPCLFRYDSANVSAVSGTSADANSLAFSTIRSTPALA